MNYYGQKIMTGSVVMTVSQVDQSHTRGTISEFMGHHRVFFEFSSRSFYKHKIRKAFRQNKNHSGTFWFIGQTVEQTKEQT